MDIATLIADSKWTKGTQKYHFFLKIMEKVAKKTIESKKEMPRALKKSFEKEF
jgi:hypothetical protein